MNELQRTVETLSSIAGLLQQSETAAALSLTNALLAIAQRELAEMENWIEAEAAAQEAWRLNGAELCRDLNSYPAAVEEIPW